MNNVTANLNIKPFYYKTNSDVAVLTLHGYLESCYTMTYFNQFFKNENFNIESPNLIGHGGTYTDLHDIKYTDWILQIENIYKKLKHKGKKIIIIGYSLGGTLALYMAEKYDVNGIVLINHLFNHIPFSMRLTPFGKYFIKYVPNIKPDLKNRHPLFSYHHVSSWNSAEIIKLSMITKKNITKVKCPTLIFKSKQDHRVSKKNAEDTYKSITSENKELIYLENSYHIAPLDNDKNFILSTVKNFINRIAG